MDTPNMMNVLKQYLNDLIEANLHEDGIRLDVGCIEMQAEPYAWSEGIWTPVILEKDTENPEAWYPKVNFRYSLSSGWTPPEDPDELRKKMRDCTVIFLPEENLYYLALTKHGRNSAWEICETFMNLGYLPPTTFCDLPKRKGFGESKRDRWIIQACARSLALQAALNIEVLSKLSETWGIKKCKT